MQFNNMTPGDTLAPFYCFGITALADLDGVMIETDAESRSRWGIYGRNAHGEAFPIHDAADAKEIARAAAQIERQTGKPFYYSDTKRPNTTGGPLIELCEHLTFTIHEEIPGHDDDPETLRDDDFDTHPLSELREALCAVSGYDGQEPDAAQRHEAEQDEITALCEAGECGHVHCKEENQIVIRAAPLWAWEIIDETLSIDAGSRAFDPGLRESIRKAHVAVMLASELAGNEPLSDTDPRLDDTEDTSGPAFHEIATKYGNLTQPNARA